MEHESIYSGDESEYSSSEHGIEMVLKKACLDGDVDKLEETFNDGEVIDVEKRRLFDVAIYSYRVSVLEYLMEKFGYEIWRNKGTYGGIADISLTYNDKRPVESMLKRKAEIGTDDLGEVNKQIVKGEEITDFDGLEKQDDDGWCALHHCVIFNRTDVLKEIVTPELLEIQDFAERRTPLLLAATFDRPEIFKTLVESRANKSAKNCNGESVFHLATRHNSIEVMELLIADGVDIENDTNSSGLTPLLTAIMHSNPEAVKVLLQNGVSPNGFVDPDTLTTLAHFICNQKSCRKSDRAILRLLISYNADIDLKNLASQSPLHIAFKNHHEALVEILLKNNAVWTSELLEYLSQDERAYKIYLSMKRKQLVEQNSAYIYPLNTLSKGPLRFGHTLTNTGMGELYLFGGFQQGTKKKKLSNQLIRFKANHHPTNRVSTPGKWKAMDSTSGLNDFGEVSISEKIYKENSPEKRAYHSAVFLNGSLYIYGGETVGKKSLSSFYSYNIKSKQWTDLTPHSKNENYPGVLTRHTAIIGYSKLYDTKDIYSQGDISEIQSKLGEYKGSRDPRMIHMYPDAPNVEAGSQKMYLYGGESKSFTASEEVWEYTFATNEWRKVPDGPPGRYFHTAIYDDDSHRMIVHGGNGGDEVLGDTWEYNLFDFTASALFCDGLHGKSPKARMKHAATLFKERMFIGGGVSKKGKKLCDLWYLDLQNSLWVKVLTGPRFSARRLFGFEPLNDKHFVVHGGDGTQKTLLVHLPEPLVHHKIAHLREMEGSLMHTREEGFSQGTDTEIEEIDKTNVTTVLY